MGQASHITEPARRKKTEVSNPWNFSLKPFQSLDLSPKIFGAKVLLAPPKEAPCGARQKRQEKFPTPKKTAYGFFDGSRRS